MLLVDILDAVPLDSERLGDIKLSTLGRLGDLEGYRRVRDYASRGDQSTYRPRKGPEAKRGR